MDKYKFSLGFKVSDPDENPEKHIDALFEAGCNDATISTGKRGHVQLDFMRESHNLTEALTSAISNVQAAIPDADLVDVTFGKDLVYSYTLPELSSAINSDLSF